jgi:hypothetical protein
MWRRLPILLLGAILGCAAGGGLVWLYSKEPPHPSAKLVDRHPLNYWVEGLQSGWGSGRDQSIDALVKFGPEAVRPCAKLMDCGDRATEDGAARVLNALGAPALPAVIEKFADDDLHTRSRALTVFRGFPLSVASTAVPRLCAIATSKRGLAAAEALEALEFLGDDAAAAAPDVLMVLLDNDKASETARRTLRAFYATPSDDQVARLIAGLVQHPNEWAIRDMLARGGPSVDHELSRLAHQPRAEVRLAAVDVLRTRINRPTARDVLARFIDDPVEMVAIEARRALAVEGAPPTLRRPPTQPVIPPPPASPPAQLFPDPLTFRALDE